MASSFQSYLTGQGGERACGMRRVEKSSLLGSELHGKMRPNGPSRSDEHIKNSGSNNKQ